MTGVSRHTVCWLLCQGQTAWNREHRYLSRTDLPLTGFGRERADGVARRLRRQPLTAIVHTGSQAAAEVAEAVAAARDKAPEVAIDQRWRTADYGHWEGLCYRELMERYATEAGRRFADPWTVAPDGGETLEELWTRVLAAWQELLARYDGGRIAVIGQSTPIQLVLCHLLGIPRHNYWQMRIDLGSVSCVDLYPSAAIMRTINEAPALRGPASRDLESLAGNRTESVEVER
jgi:broad specificity phosphatase PhoE